MNRYPLLLLLAAIPLAGCSHEGKPDAPAPEKKASPHDESLVHLDAAAQERLGVAVAELAPRSLRPQVQAYGRVVADPAQTFELRAPIAGTVRDGGREGGRDGGRAGGDWPAIGSTLPDGAPIGSIEPRLSAIERADLGARLAAAKGDEATAAAALDVAKSELERAKTLNADGKNVSDRALEEVQGRVKVETARLSAASESRRDIEAALDPKVFATGAIPLVLARGGEVLEVLARPGESVESGALIARIGRFDPALVRVELPIGVSVGKSERATVVAAAHPERPLAAQRVGLAPNSESEGQALLFRAPAGDLNLRPGEAVTAWIESDAPAVEGFVVPRSAVVRHAGKAWVYVRAGDAAFAREELAVDRAVPEGWLTTAEWAKDARVVVAGAQSVLSAEIQSTSGGGGEEQ